MQRSSRRGRDGAEGGGGDREVACRISFHKRDGQLKLSKRESVCHLVWLAYGAQTVTFIAKVTFQIIKGYGVILKSVGDYFWW